MSLDNFPTALTTDSSFSLVKRLKPSATFECPCTPLFFLKQSNWKKAKDVLKGEVVDKHISWLNSEPEEGQSKNSIATDNSNHSSVLCE